MIYYEPVYFTYPVHSKRIIQSSEDTYMTMPYDTIQDLITRFKVTPELLLQLNPDLTLAPEQVIRLL